MGNTELSEEHEYPKVYMSKKVICSCLLFIVAWIILGIVAFVQSLMCFGKKGSKLDKIFGFILAVLFGPLYWVFFYSNQEYCRL